MSRRLHLWTISGLTTFTIACGFPRPAEVGINDDAAAEQPGGGIGRIQINTITPQLSDQAVLSPAPSINTLPAS